MIRRVASKDCANNGTQLRLDAAAGSRAAQPRSQSRVRSNIVSESRKWLSKLDVTLLGSRHALGLAWRFRMRFGWLGLLSCGVLAACSSGANDGGTAGSGGTAGGLGAASGAAGKAADNGGAQAAGGASAQGSGHCAPGVSHLANNNFDNQLDECPTLASVPPGWPNTPFVDYSMLTLPGGLTAGQPYTLSIEAQYSAGTELQVWGSSFCEAPSELLYHAPTVSGPLCITLQPQASHTAVLAVITGPSDTTYAIGTFTPCPMGSCSK